MLLRRTEEAIEELAANVDQVFGQHWAGDLVSGNDGVVVGEALYDPGSDEPSDIDPGSTMAIATDTYYVEQSIPQRPLALSIIEYRDPREAALAASDSARLRRIWYGKQALSKLLVEALWDALPGTEDIVASYVIGLPTDADKADKDIEIIDNTEDPAEAAKQVAEIAYEGLTILIGNLKLPLEEIEDADYSSLVAIKANHLIDRRLIPNDGIWRTGHPKMPEVDTSDPRQLERWNSYLELRHKKRVDTLEDAGISIAAVVYNPLLKPFNIDVLATDKSIASAIEQVGSNL